MTDTTKPVKQIAAGIIVYNGKVLIAQRRRGKDLAFFWEFPGGKLEQGETLEQCLQRELIEEMNLKINVGSLFMSLPYDYPFGSFVINAFMATCDSPDIKNFCEHEQYKWVKPEEMSAYRFSPADVPIVEAYIKKCLKTT